MPPLRRLTSAAAAVLLGLLAATPRADAQEEEIIFDPENQDPTPAPDEAAPTTPPPPDPAPPPRRVGYTTARYRLTGGADLRFDRPGEDVWELHNTLWLQTRQPLGEDAWAEVSARLAHSLFGAAPDDPQSARALYAADLGDAWISTRWGNLLLRAGQQRITWGSAELTRPADVVNPLDLTAAFTAPDALSLTPTRPILAAKLDWVGEHLTLSGVLIPFFEPHRLSLLSTDFGVARGASPLASQHPALGLLERLIDPSLVDGFERAFAGTRIPDQTPQNASVGLRLTSNALGPDLAFGWLYGWDRTPVVHIDPDLRRLLDLVAQDDALLKDLDLLGFVGRNPEVFPLQQRLAMRARDGEALLAMDYRRWHVLEIDGAGYIGPVGVRADLAFSPQRTFITSDLAAVRRPATHAALELSWEGDDGALILLAEPFWLHIFDAPSGEARPLLFRSDLYGLAFAARADLQALDIAPLPLTLQAGGLVSARDGDSILNLGLAWTPLPSTRVALDLQLFNPAPEGASDALGSLYNPNDRLLLSLEQRL